MRANVELAILGAAVVYIAFFSWPVPSIVKDIYHSGVGRAVVLGSIVYLAKFQSIPLAILLSIYYCKACSEAYREAFEVPKPPKEEKKEKKDDEKDKPPPPAVPGNVTTAPPSGGATASPSTSGTTEHYMNFSTF